MYEILTKIPDFAPVLAFLPLLAAAMPLIGAGLDAATTSAQNRKSYQFSREMYERTKNDNLAFWDQQNKYNAPAAQMQRLKEAGLNPNLVYGGSGPSGQASPIQTPDVQSAQFRSPDFSGAFSQSASNLAEFQNMEIRQAQLDNLFAQGSVLKQEALLKAAQIGSTTAATARTQFDLDFASELRNTSADFLRTQVDKMKADVQFTLNQTELNTAMNSANIQEAVSRIATARLQRDGMRLEQARTKVDTAIRNLDLKYYKQGIPPGSPFYAKLVAQILERILPRLQGTPQQPARNIGIKRDITDKINDFFNRH